MANTKVEYLTKRWQAAMGCNESLPCAARCWAKGEAWRMAHNGIPAVAEQYDGLVYAIDPPTAERALCSPLRWTGTVRLNERHLADPLRWRKPQRIGVAFGGDWMLLPTDDHIRLILSIAASAAAMNGHNLFFLTKRAERLLKILENLEWYAGMAFGVPGCEKHVLPLWCLPKGDPRGKKCNLAKTQMREGIHFGVSVTNQEDADKRLPLLRKIAMLGWKTWISYEPALGAIDWEAVLNYNDASDDGAKTPHGLFSWLVAGGESGKDARPAHPDWLRAARDACAESGTPFYLKQWGEWQNGSGTICEQQHDAVVLNTGRVLASTTEATEEERENWSLLRPMMMCRVGKRFAGRTLDGRTHEELPHGC